MSTPPGSTPEIATISIPADAQFVRTVRQVVSAAAACVPDRVDDVRLAVNEAIALALGEGIDRVDITIAMAPAALTISVPVENLPQAPDPDEIDVVAMIEALTDVTAHTSSGLTLTWIVANSSDR